MRIIPLISEEDKRAGIIVQYCAEQFENDGSPVSTIVKGVKRAMAGEYSRELSAGDRELVVNEAEAATVREIFEAYIRLGSASKVQDELHQRGIASKRWTSSSGRMWGGSSFSRGALYWLLRNSVYVGRVVHKGQVYEGRQKPIVDLALWERAQELLSTKSAARERRPIVPGGRPLAGLLFDDRGNAMSPTFTIKRNGRRYPYYVSQALLQNDKASAGSTPRVPAEQIERLVQQALGSSDHPGSPEEILRQQIERVVVHPDRVEIVRTMPEGFLVAEASSSIADRTVFVTARLVHRNRARILDDGAAGPNPAVVRALCRAYEWRDWLERGEALSFRAIASRAGVTSGYVQVVLPLAFLAPSLTRELLDGRRRLRGALMVRLHRRIPLGWCQQIDCL